MLNFTPGKRGTATGHRDSYGTLYIGMTDGSLRRAEPKGPSKKERAKAKRAAKRAAKL